MSDPTCKDEAPALSETKTESPFVSRAKNAPKRIRRRRPNRPFNAGHSARKSILPIESKQQLVDHAFFTAPNLDCYPIFVSLHGLISLCFQLHENLKLRDRQMYHLSASEIFYPSLQYAILKMMRCDAVRGYVDQNLSILESTFSDVMFPSIIADYLDSIGRFTMSNGITVAPSLKWIQWNDREMIAPCSYVKRHFIHPGLCVPGYQFPQWYECVHADVQIPQIDSGYVSIAQWAFVPDAIQRYRRLIPRMTKSVDMRVPTPSCEGQSNIIVSRQKTDRFDLICGCAPQLVSDEVARLGAVFGWNDYAERGGWPGDRELLLPWTTGMMFSLSNVLSKYVQTKMKLFTMDQN